MHRKYNIVFIVTLLLVTLSLSISVINYTVSLHSTEEQLKNRSLPLSVDNIYTEIQKHIIEPNLVSSMMANDTFVKDWLINEEAGVDKITRYLDMIKNKYEMFTTFLVSEKTQNYYTAKGLIDTIKTDDPNNSWYFDFKESPGNHEINLDFNARLDNAMIMFINYKILDNDFHLIGATGIGLKISYINDMLKHFRHNYMLNVYFLNESGEVILAERRVNTLKHIDDDPELSAHKDAIITKDNGVLSLRKKGSEYLLNTKYIPELHLYLVVEAKVDDFIKDVRKTFYLNMIISLLVTALIAVMILLTVRSYHKRLEYLAGNDTLTDLPNRRHFNEEFNRFFQLHQRNKKPLSLLFFDVDDFKSINDTFGHQTGDAVLVRVAEIIRHTLRESDLVARWGGEEFIVAFIDTDLEEAAVISERLRHALAEDIPMRELVHKKVTASFGMTASGTGNESIDALLTRLDEAMYEAKQSGKNRIVTR